VVGKEESSRAPKWSGEQGLQWPVKALVGTHARVLQPHGVKHGRHTSPLVHRHFQNHAGLGAQCRPKRLGDIAPIAPCISPQAAANCLGEMGEIAGPPQNPCMPALLKLKARTGKRGLWHVSQT
jgi:hypothetical protein